MPKKWFIDGLEVTGLNAILRPFYSGRGVIFLLHRVIPTGAPCTIPGNAITTDFLDGVLPYVRKLGWDIVSLREALSRLAAPHPRTRFACFTLDDGFRDNLTLGLPVFEAHDAPFSVFICTGFVEHRSHGDGMAVTERLPVGIHLAEHVAVSLTDPRELKLPNDASVDLTSAERLFTFLSALESREPSRFRDVLEDWFATRGKTPGAVLDEAFLDWSAARLLASHRLVEIGAHSLTHPRLSTLHEAECGREMAHSRTMLEAELCVPVPYFAYPYGSTYDCGVREFELAQRFGFLAGLTTRRGNIFEGHVHARHMLPRVPISMVPHAATHRFVKAALYGSRNAVMNRFARVARE